MFTAIAADNIDHCSSSMSAEGEHFGHSQIDCGLRNLSAGTNFHLPFDLTLKYRLTIILPPDRSTMETIHRHLLCCVHSPQPKSIYRLASLANITSPCIHGVYTTISIIR